MKKFLTVLLALVLMLSMLSACTLSQNNDSNETSVPTSESDVDPTPGETDVPTAEPTDLPTVVPTSEPTPEPTAEPTPVPTAEPTVAPTAVPTKAPTPTATPAPTPFPIPDAYVGYYDSVKRVSVIPGETYLNLFENRIYYTTPGSQAVIPAPGNASDWSVQKDEFSLVKKTEVISGRFVLTTNPNKTGYLYLKNKKTAEVVKVYVNLAASQEADRKQTDKNVPYYLYLEKGSYTNFIPGTCCLTIYKADKDGYYTIPYLTLLSSAGTTISLTPIGVHTLDVAHRERWHPWVEDGAPSMWGQYVISYAKGRFTHSPCTGPGAYDDISQMDIVSNYNYVGTHCSGGCLRMQTGSAYWIWCNCTVGTKLKIVNGNPLGTKIEPLVKINKTTGYDPTDPYLYTGKMIDV